MPVATLTKAASYRAMTIPNKHFVFEVPMEVTQEEVELLRSSGFFKFEDEAPDAPEAGETIVKPAGGIKIRTKAPVAEPVETGVAV